MQDAFRQALEQGGASELDVEILRAVEAEAARPVPLSEAELGRLREQVRGVGRGWRGYINAGEASSAHLRELQSEWQGVVAQLRPLPTNQRVRALQDLAQALDFADGRQARRMKAYLSRRGGPHSVLPAAVAPLAIAEAYLVLAIEELGAHSSEDIRTLEVRLADASSRGSSGLFAALGAWIGGD